MGATGLDETGGRRDKRSVPLREAVREVDSAVDTDLVTSRIKRARLGIEELERNRFPYEIERDREIRICKELKFPKSAENRANIRKWITVDILEALKVLEIATSGEVDLLANIKIKVKHMKKAAKRARETAELIWREAYAEAKHVVKETDAEDYAKVKTDFDSEMQTADRVTDIQQIVTQVETVLAVLEVIEEDGENKAGANNTTPQMPMNSTMREVRSHYKIELPRFDGSRAEEFRAFMAVMRNEILESDLSDQTKTIHLVGRLTGKAKRAILDIPIEEIGSLGRIIERLEGEFGGEKENLEALQKEMLKLKTDIPYGTQGVEVRIDKIRETVALMSRYRDIQDDPFIQQIILESLPKWMTTEIIGEKEKARIMRREFTIKDIISVARVELVKRASNDRPPGRFERNRDTQAKEGALYRDSTRPACVYCDSINHFPSECNRVNTVEDRKRKLRETDRCLKCLKKGHRARECGINKPCFNCKRIGHHQSICLQAGRPPQMIDNRREPPRYERNAFNPRTTTGSNATPVNGQIPNRMHARKVEIKGIGENGKDMEIWTRVRQKGKETTETKVRAYLDTGCSHALIDKRLSEMLGVQETEEKTMNVQTVGNGQGKEIQTREREIEVIDTEGNPMSMVVLEIEDLNRFFTGEIDEGDGIKLVISAKYLPMLDVKTKGVSGDGSTVMSSTLGEFRTGSGKGNSAKMRRIHIQEEMCKDEEERDMIKMMYEVDGEISATEGIDEVDQKVWDKVVREMKVEGGRVQVTLPWVDEDCGCPQNLGLAYSRLKNVLQRCDRDTFRAFEEYLQEQVALGVIEKVKYRNNIAGKRVHYIPFQAVYKADEKGIKKLRIVYDAASKTKGNPALNELLHRGPVIMGDLTGIQLRFLIAKYVTTSDIEKAFLQIGIQERDRDVLRFLFVRSLESEWTGENVITYRFRRLPFGVVSSPSILAIVIKHHLDNKHPEIAEEVQKNIYVDNIIICADTERKVLEHSRKAREAFAEISMNLRDFKANSAELNKYIPINSISEKQEIKVLGFYWDSDRDTVNIRTPEWKEKPITKRELLKITASIFDPLGRIQPIKVGLQILIQRTWQEGYDWDQEVKGELEKEIRTKLEGLVGTKVEFERPAGKLGKRVILHVFTDASLEAAGAVVYGQDEETRQVVMLMSKSRVKPYMLRRAGRDKNKDKIPMTVNIMEMIGVDLGRKLLEQVKRELDKEITTENLWTDSQCCIGWIKGKTPKENVVFIKNRVNRLNETKIIVRHVSGTENPADIVSRGCDLRDLERNELWFNGPELLRDPSKWAKAEEREDDTEPETIDIKKIGIEPKEPKAGIVEELEKADNLGSLLHNLAHFSDPWTELVRVEQALHPPREEQIKNLGIMKAGGIYELRNRVLAEVDDQERIVFLQKSAKLLRLLVRELHQSVHPDIGTTLNMLRKKVYFPGGKRTVRKILHQECDPCRRALAKPFERPEMAALPKERFTIQNPFTYTGTDLAGPFKVRLNNKDDKSDTVKCWVVIFTCLTTRAVMLETMREPSTEEYMYVFRKFVARFGCPIRMYSDNASYFKLFDKVLNQVETERRPEWKFIVERGPWQGGYYERLVGIMKENLRKAIRNERTYISRFETLIKEIESNMNDRPILSALLDSEPGQVITPHMIISPHKNGELRINTEGNTEKVHDPDYKLERPDNRERLIEIWENSQRKRERFWEKFKKDYLRAIREPTDKRAGKRTPIRVGQIILLDDEKTEIRNLWRVGTVEETVPSTDGIVRAVKVRVGNKLLVRPLERVLNLEGDLSEERDGRRNGRAHQHRARRGEGQTVGQGRSQGRDREISERDRGEEPQGEERTKRDLPGPVVRERAECGRTADPQTAASVRLRVRHIRRTRMDSRSTENGDRTHLDRPGELQSFGDGRHGPGAIPEKSGENTTQSLKFGHVMSEETRLKSEDY